MYKLLFLLPVFALLISGCTSAFNVDETVMDTKLSSNTPPVYEPVTIENIDSKGEPMTQVYTAPPQRIVAVWQNSIETPLALGAGDRIVAGMGIPNRKYIKAEYREAYDRIPYTSLENLDIETILMMEPDLIIGWASTFSAKTLRGTDFWQARGIHTYIAPSSSAVRIKKPLMTNARIF